MSELDSADKTKESTRELHELTGQNGRTAFREDKTGEGFNRKAKIMMRPTLNSRGGYVNRSVCGQAEEIQYIV